MNTCNGFFLVLIAITGMVSIGCVDQDDEEATSVDPLASTVTEQPLAAHGGGGGVFTGHVTPSAVIYGLQVNSGDFVDHITLFFYQPTKANNVYNGEPVFSQSFGGGGGRHNSAFYCPANKGIIGIRGASGSFVDAIGVICGNVTNPDPFSSSNTFSPLWGGTGGRFFDSRCGVGRLVDSFNVRTGAYVDNLQPICINSR